MALGTRRVCFTCDSALPGLPQLPCFEEGTTLTGNQRTWSPFSLPIGASAKDLWFTSYGCWKVHSCPTLAWYWLWHYLLSGDCTDPGSLAFPATLCRVSDLVSRQG